MLEHRKTQLHFVMESPQTTTEPKPKRPRLVTSCDHCRAKKIKCVYSSADEKCDACSLAKVPCRFHDRDRYLEERSRVMAEPTGRASSSGSRNSHSPAASTGPRTPPGNISLFVTDQYGQAYPHPNLMPHFIAAFVDNLGNQCPFITYEDVSARFNAGTLEPVLSNAIASLAVRFSDHHQLRPMGLLNIAQTYANTAKRILADIGGMPTLPTLHGLMLISWSESQVGHINLFLHYCDLSMQMALALGLNSPETFHHGVLSQYDESLLRDTWVSVYQLNLYGSTLARPAGTIAPHHHRSSH